MCLHRSLPYGGEYASSLGLKDLRSVWVFQGLTEWLWAFHDILGSWGSSRQGHGRCLWPYSVLVDVAVEQTIWSVKMPSLNSVWGGGCWLWLFKFQGLVPILANITKMLLLDLCDLFHRRTLPLPVSMWSVNWLVICPNSRDHCILFNQTISLQIIKH